MMRTVYAVMALFIFLSGCHTPEPLTHKFTCKPESSKKESVYALKSAQCLTPAKLLERIGLYQVIFVGDHHDEVEVQKFTAQLITALAQQGKKIHVANEWFTPQDNEILQKYCSGEINASILQEDSNWSKRVGYDFKNYELIYNATKDANGSLYGINLSRAFQKLISKNDMLAMTWEQQAFVNHMDLNVSAHEQLIAPYLDHCKHSKSVQACKKRMYRVQVAWDSYMGDQSAQLAKKLLRDQDDVLIIFVGAMHLSDSLGVNLRFARKSHLPFVTLLPLSDTEDEVKSGEADYLFLYTEKEEES